MKPKSQIISTNDLPEHIDAEIRKIVTDITSVVNTSDVRLVYTALTAVLSRIVFVFPKEVRDVAIDALAPMVRKMIEENTATRTDNEY